MDACVVEHAPPSPYPLADGQHEWRDKEEVIKEICAEVLRRPIERVRANKSFVAQGGDSLLAISLMGRCREVGYNISIHDIMQSGSILELCQSVSPERGYPKLEKIAEVNGVRVETIAEDKSSNPVTELRDAYSLSGYRQTKILQIRAGISEDSMSHAVRLLMTQVSLSQTTSCSETAHDTFIYEARESELDMDEVRKRTKYHVDAVLGLNKSHPIAFIAFVQPGTPNVNYLRIDASRGTIDSKSWEIILDGLEAVLNANETNKHDHTKFGDEAHEESLRSLGYASPLHPPLPDSTGLAHNAAKITHNMDSVADEIESQEILVHISPDVSQMLLEEAIHEVLRSRPSDFVVAALQFAMQSSRINESGRHIFHTILNGRASHNAQNSPLPIGCFDDSFDLVIEREIVERGDIDLLRTIKDQRLQHARGAIIAKNVSLEVDTCIAVDSTFLESTTRSHYAAFQEIDQWQHMEKDYLQSLPITPTIYVGSYWNQGHLQFCFRSDKGLESLEKAAYEFQSALSGLLSRFRNYEVHASLADFPRLDITYPELDHLLSNQLRHITPYPLRDVVDVSPCSRTQEIFLISQMAKPEMYQCTVVTEINSTTPNAPLDYTRLCNAWKRVVEWHASLRTVFIESDRRPGHFDQVVLKKEIAPLRYYCDGDGGENILSELLSRNPVTFDNKYMTHNAILCRRSAHSAILRLEVSHALMDGQSFNVLFHDLSRAYLDDSATCTAIPYQNFVTYQQNTTNDECAIYWSSYLRGAQPSAFPTSGTDLGFRDLSTARLKMELDPGMMENFYEKYDATAANLCQVAWALVLGSYTGLDDVCFSYVNSGRHAPINGIENAMGTFVDTMICRVKLSGDETVAHALSCAKQDLVQGLSWPGTITMEHEIEDQKASHYRGNTIMTFQMGISGEVLGGSGIEFEILDETNPSDYDISLNIQPFQTGLDIRLDYWKSRISEPMAEVILECFQKALLRLIQDDIPLREMDVVPAIQIQQSCARSENFLPRVETLVHDSVPRMAAFQPKAFAVQGWDGDLTYQELNTEADKLASYLQGLGGKPEAKIATCFDKSKWAAIAQLAILKSGATVVPLGVSQPMKRVAIILQDIEASVVLTTAELAPRFTDTVTNVVVVDAAKMSQLSHSQPSACLATPDSLAFIIYTSGSTGVPKGVMLTHGGICTSLSRTAEHFKFGPHTRMVQFAAYTFDAAILDFFVMWHAGGCTCIISEADRLNGLATALRLYNVNCAFLTSTVAETISPQEVPSMATLALIGEAVKPAVVNRWTGHALLFNGYGPSECTIISSENRIRPGCNSQNVGHAINGAFWVVAPTNPDRLLPTGAIGELLIEGPHLARGYLNDTEKTSSSFIIDPAWVSAYGLATSKRLYRTGDLVQQNPDGSIVYVGRRDTQIKLRGQRVETAEIEHHLIDHDTVVDTAICLPTEGACKGRLVAIICLRDFILDQSSASAPVPVGTEQLPQARLQTNALGDWLLDRVPLYMIPTVWIPLASMLPQNDSGKLDRARLGKWANDMDTKLLDAVMSATQDDANSSPATPLHVQIQGIWAEVLDLPLNRISIEQRSFLSLGGDSITAMKAVSLARAKGISLLVPDILQSRSIAQLTDKIDTAEQTAINQSTIPKPFALLELDEEGLGSLLDQILPGLEIASEDVEDMYPCTPMQQGILMSQARSPRMYQTEMLWQMQSPNVLEELNVERIAQALQTLTDRHPIMRTIFAPRTTGSGDYAFDQVVLKSSKTLVKRVFCKEDDVDSLIATMANTSVGDYGNHPNHKATIFTTISGLVYVHYVINHALSDGSSLALLERELTDIYEGKLTADMKAPSYSSYVSFLKHSERDVALSYWKSKLSDATACFLPSVGTALLADDASVPLHQNNSLRHLITAKFENGKLLREFSEQENITMANVFQLAWALVLSKYTGSNDVLFGYLASGRDVPLEGAHELFGPLVNMMVTRVKIDFNAHVQKALQNVQAEFFDNFSRQRTPLLDIWHALKAGGRGLFNTYLSYRQASLNDQHGRSLIKDTIAVQGTSEYDAGVDIIVESDHSASVVLDYSPEFMSHDTAARIIGSLQQTIAALVESKNSLLRDIRVIADQDVHQLRQWNSDIPNVVAEFTIHDYAFSPGRLQPDATAVSAWDGELTYRELDELGDRLASHLVNHLGLIPQSNVAFCFDKSRWAIVAQLAIFKAGGVVVPMSPKDPIERLGGILQDINAHVVITTSHHASRFTNKVSNIIELDVSLRALPSIEGAQMISATVGPESAAFIIYTSGSTGKPKGVVLTHSSLISSIQAQGKIYGLSTRTRTIQFVSYTFDLSITDIWATLCHGGCICVMSEDERMNSLQSAIHSYQANFALLTPTVAALLNLSTLVSLDTLVLAGEPLKPIDVEKHLQAQHVKIFNGYGPSECSIITTCSQPLQCRADASVIGRPILGAVWLIDNIGNICPIGAVGEIWVEGPLVARGYLNNKDQTDKAFLVDPPWARLVGPPGRRFYRTGDLAWQNSGGDIIYLERKDTQIKIRGNRVEIGEIEYAVKKRMSGLRNVVASLVVAKDKLHGPQLAVVMEFDGGVLNAVEASDTAFLKISKNMNRALADLRSALPDALPRHMLPRLYVPVTRLPTTTSGKVDRRTLRENLESLSESEFSHYALSDQAKSAPSTEAEKQLQSIWATTLLVDPDQVGIDDNFFHSGGDSYLAMRLVSAIQDAGLNLCLSVSDVFQNPKLADMAHVASRNTTFGQQREELVPFSMWKDVKKNQEEIISLDLLSAELLQVAAQCTVSVEDIEDIYPCTPLQEGLMAATAQQSKAYIGRWAYRIPESLDVDRFKSSWSLLVTRTPILRTRIIPGRLSGALQVVVREHVTWYSSSDLMEYLEEDSIKSISYGSKLVRLAIIGNAPQQRHFVWTAHHSVYDGWSLTKILEGVSSIYTLGEIPRSPVSYSRFIQYVESQDQTTAKLFWRSQLDGDLDECFPSLPTPSYKPHATQNMTFHINIGHFKGSITLASLLRAAWALTVSSHSNSKVLFAMPLSGRSAPVPGVLDIVAPTLTTVPIAIAVNDNSAVRDYLAEVHQQSVDMLPFEHTGLQHIRRLVGHDIELRHLFAVQSYQEREDDAAGDFLGLQSEKLSAEGFDSYALIIECIIGLNDGSALDVVARFDNGVISTPQMQLIIWRFEHIMTQLICVNNEIDTGKGQVKLVGDIEMLSPLEVAQLAEMNRNIPSMDESLLHDLVSQHAIFTPEMPAICAFDGELSYRELEQFSQQLACRLVDLGVGPEVPVLHCFDKSKWAIVATMAILKAGGAMVPVKADPVSRLQVIVERTKSKIMLTSPQHAPQLQDLLDHIVCLDQAYLSDLKASPGTFQSLVKPCNAAFIMFTSGSTGTPKGVILEHGSLTTSLKAQAREFGATSHTRSLQFSSFTFDMSLHDIFVPLVVGGCACLPSEDEKLNDLAGAINRLRVNYMMLTPKVLGTLSPEACPGVRSIMVGGEIVHAEHLNRWLLQARVLHVYGPTECSIITAGSEVEAGVPLSLGHALAGGLWVTNPTNYNQLCPLGSMGELLIEGPILARGYFQDAEKTAVAFVDNPKWLAQYGLNHTGQHRRMYRTGDLVIRHQDGTLSYVNRLDGQVKIRGQRVEAGEIEHHIKLYQHVEDAVVLYPRQGPCQSRLIGLLTLHEFMASTYTSDIQPCSSDELPRAITQAEVIGQQLVHAVPEYMIPHVWISLRNMPQNNNHKVDRPRLTRWLEGLDAEYFQSITTANTEPAQKPASDIEGQLQELLSDILNLPLHNVALNRSFLSMGGDSITSMQLVSHCRARYGISLHVRDILQSKSISQLALKVIPENIATSSTGPLDTKFKLSPIQQLFFREFASQGLAVDNEDRFNQSVCLIPKRRLEEMEITRAVEDVVSIHPMLRARFNKTGKSFEQSTDADIESSFYVGFHEARNQKEVEDIIWSGQRCLDIEHGPIFAVHCIEVECDHSQVLFLVAHHLIVDIVSWQIIIRDLGDLLQGGKSVVSNESLSFQHWLDLQTKYASQISCPDDVLPVQPPIEDYTYWGMQRQSNVYGDRIDKRIVLSDCASVLFGEYQPFRSEPIEVLLAGLFHSFSQVFTDRTGPTVFNEGHGREPWADSLDLSNTVGWFTTMTPIHVTVDSDDVLHTLKRTKDLRRSIPERGFSYFTSRFLTPEGKRAFASHDRPEIMFNFGGRHHGDKGSQSLFSISNSFNGSEISPIGKNIKRIAIFEIEASIQHEDLVINVGFNKHMQKLDQVDRWVQAYRHSLGELIKRLPISPITFTLADFPLLNTTYDELRQIQTQTLPLLGITNMDCVDDIYPCSPAQKTILMSQLKDPSTFHVQSTCEFRSGDASPVDLPTLARAWHTVVSRHSILRTLCIPATSGDGSFFQVVLKQLEPHVTNISCPTSEDVSLAFDRNSPHGYAIGGPEHRLGLCTTSIGQVFARLSINHTLVDISSLYLIINEVALAYDGLLADSPAPSFGTYVDFLQQSSASESLQYWVSRLENATPKSLPLLLTSTDSCNSFGDFHAQIDDLQPLHAFRNKYGVTVANILQVAWALVLAKHTASSDVIFGYVANGRDAPVTGVSEMAGPLINMMVSRIDFGTQQLSVAQTVEQVQTELMDAFKYQRTSLSDIENATSLTEEQMFQTVMSIVREPSESDGNTNGLSVHGLSSNSLAKYDVSVNAICGESCIRLGIQYSTKFFDELSGRRLLESFHQAIISVATNGDEAVGELGIMGPLDLS